MDMDAAGAGSCCVGIVEADRGRIRFDASSRYGAIVARRIEEIRAIIDAQQQLPRARGAVRNAARDDQQLVVRTEVDEIDLGYAG